MVFHWGCLVSNYEFFKGWQQLLFLNKWLIFNIGGSAVSTCLTFAVISKNTSFVKSPADAVVDLC